MSSPVLYLACLLAVCVPILCTQLRRYLSYSSRHFKPPQEQHSERARRPASALRRSRPTSQQMDGTTSPDNTPPTAQNFVKPSRHPWDPPFPQRETGKATRGSWLVLPPSSPSHQTGREKEEKGLAGRLFPSDLDGDVKTEDLEETEPQAPDPAPGRASQHQVQQNGRSGSTSILWLVIGGLAVILFVLAFAVLIAHCLAWFLVYKTEARLGEARRGVLKGGEMRLCLCAT